ncbi:MAG: hypothetical protein FWE11_09265 [Defluviitaleaceae bacterium]|nr:hypothetical protein [Defluviitaleaceae bacterium]
MKRFLASFALFAVLLLLIGCGNQEPPRLRYDNANSRARYIGTSAVEIADDFIRGAITSGTARQRINNLPSIDTTMDDSDIRFYNGRIRHDIGMLRHALFQYEGTSAQFADVVDRRNIIAEGLGIDTR